MTGGVFIVLEGIDGAGGETLAENIINKCTQEQIPCLRIRYPDYNSPWGEIIHSYLEGDLEISPKVLFLTYAADQLKDQKRIQECKQQGGIVVCDRYVTSAIAYESVLGLSYDKAVQLAETLEYEQPEFIVYLDISPEESAKRKQHEKGELDIHEADLELLTRVRQVYQTMANTNILGKWFKFDGTKSRIEIFQFVWEKILELRK